jgi:hypothetical protein
MEMLSRLSQIEEKVIMEKEASERNVLASIVVAGDNFADTFVQFEKKEYSGPLPMRVYVPSSHISASQLIWAPCEALGDMLLPARVCVQQEQWLLKSAQPSEGNRCFRSFH